MALLSKMTAVVLPAVCLAHALVTHGRLERRDWLVTLPFFALGGLVVWINLADKPVHGVRYHGGSAFVTALTSAVVVLRYARNVVWPTELRWWYGHEIELRDSLLDPAVISAFLFIAALAAFTVFLMRRRDPAAFWLLWIAITLSPTLNIVPFPSLMQDRYMYLPLLGVLAAGAEGMRIATRRGLSPQVLGWVVTAAIAACVVLSVERIEVFGSYELLQADWRR